MMRNEMAAQRKVASKQMVNMLRDLALIEGQVVA